MKIAIACCVFIDDYDRILLLHRSSDRYGKWELPGGKVEEDETAEQAALREVQEELGVDARLLKALSDDTIADDENEYHFTWFQAVVTRGEPRPMETYLFDDLDYFEIDDMMSLALSDGVQLLLPDLVSGEVVLDG